MSRNIIEVPIKRRDRAVVEIYHTDPVSGKKGLLGRDHVNQDDPSKNFLEVFDANGNILYEWKAADGGQINRNEFKTAKFIAKESFRAKGVF